MLVLFLLLAILSLILSLTLTPLVRILALRFNLVDLPDNKRKVHKKPIPRVGGIAVGAAYFLSLMAAAGVLLSSHSGPGTQLAAVRLMAPAALVIFLVGLADDIFDLKPHYKFGVQLVAASMVVAAGLRFHTLGGLELHPILSIGVSVFWLAACTNAINLIDGLDGLAGGISLLATICALIGGVITGNTGLLLATAPLAGALLGFLVFNFNPASIFLGDSGSLLLGFLLGCYSILWSDASTAALASVAPLLVLAVPLLDTTLAITRRFLRRQPIFKPDRSHIHHRLLAQGLSHRNTVLLLYASGATAGGLSLCLVLVPNRWEFLVLAAFASAVLFGIRALGYGEFDALRQIFLRGDLRREITAYLAVQNLEEGLEAARTANECWSAIRVGCKEFGLHAVRMQLGGYLFQESDDLPQSWAMRIPISQSGWIELYHHSGPVPYPNALVPFITTIGQDLADKSNKWSKHEKLTPVHSFAGALYSTVPSGAN